MRTTASSMATTCSRRLLRPIACFVTVACSSRDRAADGPLEILAGGHAWCAGYVVALGMALQREGFVVRWVTMVATNHPRGRGPRNADTHEVIELELSGGVRHVIDAMANVR